MSAFGILVEKFSGTGGAVQWNQYLYAGGEMVGVRYDYNNAPTAIRYFDKDNLRKFRVNSGDTILNS